MDKFTTQYRVCQCSKCPGDTAYHCVSCPCDLCPQCKDNHVNDLKTIDHNIMIFDDNINKILKEGCQLSGLFNSAEHKKYTKKQDQKQTFHTIRSEALFYRHFLLNETKSVAKTFHKTITIYQSEMLKKANKMYDIIDHLDKVLHDVDFKHRCLKQKATIKIYLDRIQKYEQNYENSANTPVKFLKTNLPQSQLLQLHANQMFVLTSIIKKDILESLIGIFMPKIGKRKCIGNERLLKMMPGPEFHRFLTVAGIHNCRHISIVTSDRVWVSDKGNIRLTNIQGDTLHYLKDLCNEYGMHTVNREGEMIYIDRNYSIKKLSKNMKTTVQLTKNSKWKPRCVYSSPSTKDLLVGLVKEDEETGKVLRYNQNGQEINGIEPYRQPIYITENNNGDVVVSDNYYPFGAVVVTERGGRHRFSYTRHPSGSGLLPRGICTDALSHILVCDINTHTVHMLDMEGKFLSHLLIRPSGLFYPCSLSYDTYTHRLWVGSDDIRVCVYRYITREKALKDHTSATAGVITSSNEIQNAEKDSHLITHMSSFKLNVCLHSLMVTGVSDGCVHISCVTSDLAWVSDNYNLILTNTDGDNLHHLRDIRSNFLSIGLHTLSSESELIYIDKNRSIKKLSKDMQRATTLIETSDSSWSPWCVCWSQFTGGLLVGMCRENPLTGRVIRYNQTGQITQAYQHDSTLLDLYRQPHYITENNNGDVVVSDSMSAVVVTEHGGKHRFSYTGHPSGSVLRLGGICTDALSHILVCNVDDHKVHVIDKDGRFLSFLLTKAMDKPWSISYDVNNHCLWVGSCLNNMVCVYRYKAHHESVTDEHASGPDTDDLSSSGLSLEKKY